MALAALLVVYIASELVYRLYLHHQLEHTSLQHMRYGSSSTEAPLYSLDRQAGYSYRPNVRLHLRLYDEQGNFVRENQLVSNNFGHLELEDDAMEKPASEFRIAVLGDSFSATIPSNVTWPTELESALNHDETLKKISGKVTFKVMNFGLDGTGLVQWPSVYTYKAKVFNPDLVIVNFMWNDIYRPFIYRRTIHIGIDDQVMITCTALPAEIGNTNCLNAYSFVVNRNFSEYKEKEETSRIKKEIFDQLVSRLPWFSPYPDLLASVLSGRLGLHSRLIFRSGSMAYFQSTDEALAASQVALKTIASEQKALMVLYHPTVEECLAKQRPPAVKALMEREVDVKIENMLDFLPLASSPDEIKKWYNLPYDSHPSDYGARVYAQAVEGRVAQYLSNSKAAAVRLPSAGRKN